MTNPQSFITSVAPDASIASGRTGLPVSVILAQWGIETGWGTSSLFRTSNNYAGIGGPGGFRSYPDRASGLADYIAVLGHSPYAAARSHPGDPTAAAVALGQSPWDAGHYQGNGGTPGSSLLSVIGDYNLTQYDTSPAGAPADPSTPSTSSPSSSAGGATNVGFPGVGDITSGVISGIGGALAKPLLMVTFVAAGLGLVVLGGWKAVSPSVKPAVDKARADAGTAAKAAAVA